MKADVPSDNKAHERAEDAVAVQAKHGDSCSVNQVDPGQISLTSFGDDSTEPSAFPCTSDDALVDNGAAAPKPCLSHGERQNANSSRWLTPRRQRLYSDEDRLLPSACLVLRDQRDKF